MNKKLLEKLFKCAPDTGTGSGGASDADSQQSEIDGEPSSEDSFKAPQSQSELDSYTNKAIQKALENQRKDEAKRIEEAVKAALDKEKDYSKLSEEERQQREFEDSKKAFEAEKAKFEHDKLVVQVEKDLIAKGLPSEFAELLATKDAENALEQVKTFEAAFKKAVADEVKKTVRQLTPSTGAGAISTQTNYGANLASKIAQQSTTLF
ncbi:TPA: DUF4355 domain-containing protein [Streptococcus equi subsp. zooepidemicus]|nr:DUF4355 domain-containing protein [Streptococcus equi subsp. zooepidemicus]